MPDLYPTVHYKTYTPMTSTTDTYVLYYSNCPDGFASSFISWLYFRNQSNTVDYISVSYGSPPPILNSGSEVYILDFSYSLNTLRTLQQTMKRVQVIDHHKTAMNDLANFESAIFDMEESGATLTWRYFFHDQEVPEFFQYIKDRDLWQLKLPQSLDFYAYMSSVPQTHEDWLEAYESFNEDKANFLNQGTAIQRYRQRVIESLAKSAIWLTIGGYRVPCVNSPVCFGSDICNLLLEQIPSAQFAAYWSCSPKGEHWGLRSRKDFDCSAIAKQYDGGGHAQASGFLVSSFSQSPLNPLIVLT